jgi:membrane protein
LTFSLAFFALSHLMPMIKLPAFSGILFVSILLFNNVNCMRDKGILVFNVFVLIGQVGALIGLADPVYRNSYITYLCMFVFVLAYLVLTLQEFKHRELILVIFLTYMALIVKTNIPVINSILIMLIALVSVTAGFVKKDKPVRIYGLVLSLCTCGKIALYDYWGAPILQKTILFFVVGVIALVIAGIYIILEKKCNE